MACEIDFTHLLSSPLPPFPSLSFFPSLPSLALFYNHSLIVVHCGYL